MKKNIEKQLILSLLKYHKDAGGFTWLQDIGTNCKKDQIAGSLLNKFWAIGIHGNKVPEQYLVWIVEKGDWPSRSLVHIDKNTTNNHISNLKECEENYYLITEKGGSWMVQICPGSKWINLGSYPTKCEAEEALRLGMKKFYKSYTRTDT